MIDVLTDADIRRRLTPDLAVRWTREALVAQQRGELRSPPRVSTDLGEGRLVFTTGALDGRWFGYRAYDTFDAEPGEQVVIVHDATDGRVRGIAVGNELGSRRVGAIGGVAVDALARPDASTLAIIGTGTQAWAQLWAISSVRNLTEVRVHSRNLGRRKEFAARARSQLGIPAQATSFARETVEGAAMVVLATNSPTPVIDPSWVAAGSFVTTLGPKQLGHAEFGPELVAASDAVLTDSIDQLSADDPPSILVGTPHEDRPASLGAVLTGDVPGRTGDEQRILFCSVGLAGTETFLLDRLLG